MKSRQLQHVRKKVGLSRKELSIKSGIALSKIYLYENGSGNPTEATLDKLAKALNIDIKELF